MKSDWTDLTALTGNSKFSIEKVRLLDKDITIEGHFSLPPLAQLTTEDQVFVMAFLSCHGSIKQMEKIFAVSYPTIKSRLNKISSELPFIEENPHPSSTEEVLDRLEQGEISIDEALERLEQ